jgi:hypothetical protein
MLNMRTFAQAIHALKHEAIHAAQHCRGFQPIENLPDLKPIVAMGEAALNRSFKGSRPVTDPNLIRQFEEMEEQERQILREKYTDRTRPLEREARGLANWPTVYVILILRQACRSRAPRRSQYHNKIWW